MGGHVATFGPAASSQSSRNAGSARPRTPTHANEDDPHNISARSANKDSNQEQRELDEKTAEQKMIMKDKATAHRQANPIGGVNASPLAADAPKQRKKAVGTVFGQANASYDAD